MRVLICLELGGNLGHLARVRPIIERLRGAGASVTCLAIRHHEARAHLPCPVEEAPWLRAPRHCRPSHVGHTGDSLAALGWADPVHLPRAIARWRVAIAERRPDALVVDAAPSAMLAATGLGLPILHVNDAFGLPPQRPVLQDLAVRFGRVAARPKSVSDPTAAVLEQLNRVATGYGGGPFATLGGFLLSAGLTAVNHPAELDFYGERPSIDYAGPFGTLGGSATPAWPEAEGPRVLVYLRPFDRWDALWRMLAAAGLPTIAAVGRLPGGMAVPDAAHLKICHEPVDLARLASQCDLAIGHGGIGFTSQLLVSGRPMLLIPTSIEQQAYGHTVAKAGLARVASDRSTAEIAAGLQALLMETSYIDRGREAAQRHSGYDAGAIVDRLTARLLRPGGHAGPDNL